MSAYTFAGDTVVSELPLGLDASASAADVTLNVEPPRQPVRPDFTDYVVRGLMIGHDWALGRVARSDGWHFALPPYATGSISADGATIIIQPEPTVTTATLTELITNWILVLRLAVLDRWSFHGSAVRREDGTATVVLGPSGAGKTSTAAALVAAGCELLADDTLAGDVRGDAAWIAPTSSRLRLRVHAQTMVPTIDPSATSVADDGRLIVAVRSAPAPAPAQHLLFLRRSSDHTTVEALSPNQVVQRLLQNSKIVTWSDDSHRVQEFESACDLAERVPGYELAGPDACRSADDFAEFAERILRITG